jgi:hypothetical protein
MTDLSWSTSWDSVLAYEEQILPNTYHLTINFDIVTDNGDEQNIAFERMKYFIDRVLHDSIFSSIDDEKNPFFMENFKQKLVTFPMPPQDLAIVSALFAKFRTIVDGRMDIISLELSSTQGDNVRINYDEEFAEDGNILNSHELLKAAESTPWWYRNDSGSADFFKLDPESNQIMFVTDVTGWEGTDLQWPEEEPKKSKKDASNWNPTIIPGGKTQH